MKTRTMVDRLLFEGNYKEVLAAGSRMWEVALWFVFVLDTESLSAH